MSLQIQIQTRTKPMLIRLALLFAVLSFVLTPARSQELVKPASDPPETNVSERVRVLESELERQNTKLDQLQKTLTEQQQTIQALLEKLSAQTNPVAAVNVKEGETTTTAVPTPVAEPQTPTVEQRLAKVEGQALKIGPVRVSGDFRLRFDGIFRSATDPSDPPLPHVQNARMRYRFRLNLDTDLYP